MDDSVSTLEWFDSWTCFTVVVGVAILAGLVWWFADRVDKKLKKDLML